MTKNFYSSVSADIEIELSNYKSKILGVTMRFKKMPRPWFHFPELLEISNINKNAV